MSDDDHDAGRPKARRRSAPRDSRFLPGLQPRRSLALPPALPLNPAALADVLQVGTPVQVRIPVRDVQETKAALHKLMQTYRECITVLDNPAAVGGDSMALGAVRYRLRLISQEISKVKRVKG